MKKKIALIGVGRWGKILLSKIKNICEVKYKIGSSDNLNKIQNNKIDWAVIATPNHTHYFILKKLIKKKVNIFCEKPLTENFSQLKKIFILIRRYKVKLYISDIEIFKNKKILLKKKNYIFRSKKEKKINFDFLRNFFYHDAYLLYPKLKAENILNINYEKKKFEVKIYIKLKEKSFYFNYKINCEFNKHKINNKNLTSKRDYIETMFKKIFYNKVNIEKNHLRSINCIKIIDMIQNEKNIKVNN